MFNEPHDADRSQLSRWLLRCLGAALLLLPAGLAAWSWSHGGLVATLVSADLPAADKVAAVRNAFLSFGPAAPLAYLLFVIVEVVVAPIPGLMLHAPGGVIFGGWLGGTLGLLGNVLGAGIACTAVRWLGGRRLAERWFEQGALQSVREGIDRRGFWIVFGLRVNPLTSSDLVSYAAGLTALPVWQVMLATALGMAPLSYAQAHFAAELFRAAPWLFYPALVLTAIYVAAVAVAVARLNRRQAQVDSQAAGSCR